MLSFFDENSSDKTKVKIVGFIDKVRGVCAPAQSTSIFLLIYLMAVIFFAIDKYFSSMSDCEKLAYEDACLQHDNMDQARYIECLSLASITNIKH